MITSKSPIGTASSFGSFSTIFASSSPWSRIERPASGPPTFQIGSPPADDLARSATQSTIAIARSGSEIGLHVAELATLAPARFALSPPRSKYLSAILRRRESGGRERGERFPTHTNGAPPATTSSWPLTLLKNAVGRTTE